MHALLHCSVLGVGQQVGATLATGAEKLGAGGIFGSEAEAEAAKAAAEMKAREGAGMPAPSMSLAAKQDVLEQSAMAGDADWAYARQVEITNGRWAMLVRAPLGHLLCHAPGHVQGPLLHHAAATGRGALSPRGDIGAGALLLPCFRAPSGHAGAC